MPAGWAPIVDHVRVRWRIGESGWWTIHAQPGPTADPSDWLVAVTENPEIAGHIVAVHNAWWLEMQHATR